MNENNKICFLKYILEPPNAIEVTLYKDEGGRRFVELSSDFGETMTNLIDVSYN